MLGWPSARYEAEALTHSIASLNLVKQFEGCRLTSYQDAGGIWTIGFGHTKGVGPNQVCTEEQAEVWLDCDLLTADAAVNALVRVPINQNEHDALVSFVFNVGRQKFNESTLLRKLNSYQYSAAADEFPKWNHVDGKVLPGLTHRRAAERELFLEAV